MQKLVTPFVTTTLILCIGTATVFAQATNPPRANSATAARSQPPAGQPTAGQPVAGQRNTSAPDDGKAPAGEPTTGSDRAKIVIRRPIEESVEIDGIVVKANSIVVAKKDAIIRHLTKAEKIDIGHTVKVRKVSEGWLWVRGSSIAGWVHKMDVVPFEKAVADIQAVMKSRKKTVLDAGAVGAYAEGNRALSQDDFDGAMRAFRTAISSSPDAAGPAYAGLGEAQLGKKQYQESVESLTMAIQEDDKNHVAFYNRGYAKHMLGECDPAIEDFNKAIQISGEGNADPWYYLQRGLCWYEKGEKQKAFEDHEVFAKNQPQRQGAALIRNPNVRLNQPLVTTDLGGPPIVYAAPPAGDDTYWSPEELDEAIANFSEAIRLNDQFTLAFNGRGWAKYRKKQFAEAAADFDRAIELAEQQKTGAIPTNSDPQPNAPTAANGAPATPADATNDAADLFKP